MIEDAEDIEDDDYEALEPSLWSDIDANAEDEDLEADVEDDEISKVEGKGKGKRVAPKSAVTRGKILS